MREKGSYWPSAIKDYQTCPRLYQDKHIKGIVPYESGLDAEFGTALHMGIEHMLKGEDGKMYFDTYWQSVKDKPLKKFKFDWRCLEFNGHVFLKKFADRYLPDIKPVFQEERIFATMNGRKLEGTPDVMGEYKGIPSVMDFKTSSVRYSDDMIECEEQMSFYAKLAIANGIYAPQQKVFFNFVKDFKEPSIRTPLIKQLTSEDLSATLDNVMSVIDQIESGKFHKNTQSCVRGPIKCSNFQNCWGKT